jgi:orotidine-5'-phosphate decarboxylase
VIRLGEKDSQPADGSTELIVALDLSKPSQALELVDKLQGLPCIYKVGSELFMAGGPDVVRELVHRKNRVFLDLKFHDIPNTVAKAARQAALLHVEMFTLHLAGGSQMIRAVAEEFEESIPGLRPKIIGVSVLTSFDDVRWAEVTKAINGHATEVVDSVLGFVDHSTAWGTDGVVCSAYELGKIRERAPNIYTIVPGIRPEGFASHDQARVMTPAEARKAGASAVVIGRPITESKSPKDTAAAILRDLSPMSN